MVVNLRRNKSTSARKSGMGVRTCQFQQNCKFTRKGRKQLNGLQLWTPLMDLTYLDLPYSTITHASVV